jgi:hypothetical protein
MNPSAAPTLEAVEYREVARFSAFKTQHRLVVGQAAFGVNLCA